MNALTPVETEDAVEASVPSRGERFYWVTHRGQRLFLDEMDMGHLENTYRMVFRNIRVDHPGAALLAVQVLEAELRRRGVEPASCVGPRYLEEHCDCHPNRRDIRDVVQHPRRRFTPFGW